MIVKLLTERHLEFLSLKGGCRGSSESTLVKVSNCWKSHAAAHLLITQKPAPKVFRLYKNQQNQNNQYSGQQNTIHRENILFKPSNILFPLSCN